MPKREDEFWAGMKEPRGTPLCPFCGKSERLYYNKNYKSWKCGYCEKSFPSPSYGPGGDFGKEARLRSSSLRYDRYMTPEETTRAAERQQGSEYPSHAKKDDEYLNGKEIRRSGKRMGKKKRKMTWAKEHLNWTLFLSSLLATIILYIAIGAGEVAGGNLPLLWVFLGVSIIFLIWIEIWYFRQKSRTLWFLLLGLLPNPFGLIIALCLRNMSYYVELVGRDETLGPFKSKEEIMSWYNAMEDWRGVYEVKVIHPEG